jgi:hypothetical protein
MRVHGERDEGLPEGGGEGVREPLREGVSGLDGGRYRGPAGGTMEAREDTYQKIAVTEARMFFGALVKAYSRPTTEVKISENYIIVSTSFEVDEMKGYPSVRSGV